jgi:hypothetical protein
MVDSMNSTLDRARSWVGEVALGLWVVGEALFYGLFVLALGLAVLSCCVLLTLLPVWATGGQLLGWGLAVLLGLFFAGLLTMIVNDIGALSQSDEY